MAGDLELARQQEALGVLGEGWDERDFDPRMRRVFLIPLPQVSVHQTFEHSVVRSLSKIVDNSQDIESHRDPHDVYRLDRDRGDLTETALETDVTVQTVDAL
jgi:hypothetical protein